MDNITIFNNLINNATRHINTTGYTIAKIASLSVNNYVIQKNVVPAYDNVIRYNNIVCGNSNSMCGSFYNRCTTIDKIRANSDVL